MTLKEYAEEIKALAEKHPNAIVVYARDDEGNGFDTLSYGPSAGMWDSDDNSFVPEAEGGTDVNAVCIN